MIERRILNDAVFSSDISHYTCINIVTPHGGGGGCGLHTGVSTVGRSEYGVVRVHAIYVSARFIFASVPVRCMLVCIFFVCAPSRVRACCCTTVRVCVVWFKLKFTFIWNEATDRRVTLIDFASRCTHTLRRLRAITLSYKSLAG